MSESAEPRPSIKPNVARAGGIMLVSLFLSRVLGIARDSIMSAQFGKNAMTDAYSLAFMIPDLLFFLIAGGALSSAFIPVFSEYLHTDRKKDAWRVFSSVTTIMAAGLFVVILLAWIFTDRLIPLIIKDAQVENYALIAQISRIVLPTQIAFFLGGIMFGTLYAHQKFSIPGLGPNAYNLGIIFGAVVISHFVSPGIVGMAWGAVIGAVIGNLIVPMFALRGINAEFKPTFDTKHPGVRKVFKLMLPVVLGLSLPGVYALLMRYFGTAYQGGIVTSLDLANKLMQAPLGIFGQSLAIAVFPALSQFFATQEMGAFRAQTIKSVRSSFYMSVPIAVMMAVMAPEIVNILFNHGKFTDPEPVVVALRLFCIGIPAWCAHPIMMRAYFAMQQTVKPIVLGTITTVVFVVLCLALQPAMGWAGLPLASSISAILLAVIMGLSLQKDITDLNLGDVLSGLDMILLSATAMTAVMVVLSRVIPGGEATSPFWLNTLRFLGISYVGSAIFYVLSKRMGLSESETVERGLAKAGRVFKR